MCAMCKLVCILSLCLFLFACILLVFPGIRQEIRDISGCCSTVSSVTRKIRSLTSGTNLVTIKQGIIQGTTMTSNNGKIFGAYLGIPYAQPPIGDLRFKPPLPASPWKGILYATNFTQPCMQCDKSTNEVFGQEDCLTINVYTPLNAQPDDNFPVIVYIYGGIFKTGSNSKFGPQYFMNKDIVLVMANYRLGPLGFLSTGDKVVSGNMGLKDQLLALKWTKENIFSFGGDVNRITLHGHSSGAVSAHLHTLTPSSKGLFNRVILQSGTGFGTQSFFDRKVSHTIASELAKRVGCNSSSSEEIFNCLMTVDGGTLVAQQEDMNIWKWNPDAVFRPTVEEETVMDAFITEIPIKSSYQSTDQEFLIGMTTGEMLVHTGSYLMDDDAMEQLNTDYKTIFPITLQYLWHALLKDQDFISALARNRYFGNHTIDSEMADQMTQMYTQGLEGSNVNEAIRRYPGTKFVYLYDYVSGFSIHNQIEEYGRFYGVGHADEVPQMFYETGKSIYLRPEDITFGQEMITRWVNFAYSGNPNKPFPINESLFSSWNPVTTKSVEYLRLKVNGSMETDYYISEYKFWKSLPIFSKYF